jgi:hypothetical protein
MVKQPEDGKFLFPVKALSKVFMAKNVELKAKEPIKHEQIGRIMEQTTGYFCQNLLEVQSLWWNIWVDTPTKLPLAISNQGIDLQKCCD